MAPLSVLEKLSKSEPSSKVASEASTHKKLTVPKLSALRASTAARFHTLRAAFRSSATKSTRLISEHAFVDDVDFSQRLPAVDCIGTDLQLNFESVTHLPRIEDDGQTGLACINGAEDSGLLIPQTQCQPSSNKQISTAATEPNQVNVRNSITISLDVHAVLPQHSAFFVDSSHGTTTVSVTAVSQPPSATLGAEQRCTFGDAHAPTTNPRSPSIVAPTSSDLSFSDSDGLLIRVVDDTAHIFKEPEVSHSLPSLSVLSLLISLIE